MKQQIKLILVVSLLLSSPYAFADCNGYSGPGGPCYTGPQEIKPAWKLASRQYLLSAIVITKDKRIALIQSDHIKEPQKIALGEILDGWTLSNIQPRQVTLERNGEIRKLNLGIISSPKLVTQIEIPEYKVKDVGETIVYIDEHGDEMEFEEEYEDDPD